jgi:hypothetical protein
MTDPFAYTRAYAIAYAQSCIEACRWWEQVLTPRVSVVVIDFRRYPAAKRRWSR